MSRDLIRTSTTNHNRASHGYLTHLSSHFKCILFTFASQSRIPEIPQVLSISWFVLMRLVGHLCSWQSTSVQLILLLLFLCRPLPFAKVALEEISHCKQLLSPTVSYKLFLPLGLKGSHWPRERLSGRVRWCTSLSLLAISLPATLCPCLLY